MAVGAAMKVGTVVVVACTMVAKAGVVSTVAWGTSTMAGTVAAGKAGDPAVAGRRLTAGAAVGNTGEGESPAAAAVNGLACEALQGTIRAFSGERIAP